MFYLSIKLVGISIDTSCLKKDHAQDHWLYAKL